ncbi:ABC transporter permease [Puia sp.]|jgi:putative ABC transport system permease protein|uniref:ABC transporter permease n=1 Tax=Puia sp. TaxID=2045100 RepID=UPI002F402276
MAKNYLLTAWRNLFRHPLVSFINLSSLCLSMAVCLLVLNIVRTQYAYDRWHPEGTRIYRILTRVTARNGRDFDYATTPPAVAARLLRENAHIEAAATLRPAPGLTVRANGKQIDLSGVFTDTGFFRIFNFYPSSGTVAGFAQPNTAILTQQAAEKFFPNGEATGKIISLNDSFVVRIIAVLAPTPGRTHLNYDVFLSAASIPFAESSRLLDSASGRWDKYTAAYTYVRTRPDAGSLNEYLSRLSEAQSPITKFGNGEKAILFSAQPLGKISPGHGYYLENSNSLPSRAIYILLGAITLLLLLTCFNYSNLIVARSVTRAKEIGVRKVMGASRFQVFLQFILESTLLSLTAMLLALPLVPFIPLNPSLQNLFSGASVDAAAFLYLLLFSLSTGFLSGFLPALLLSGFRATEILKSLSGLRIFRGSFFSNILFVAQFALSFLLVIDLIVMVRQSEYMSRGEYGLDLQDKIAVRIPEGVNGIVLLNELHRVPFFTRTASLSDLFGYQPTGYSKVRSANDAEQRELAQYYTDDQVVPMYGLTLLAGTGFSPATGRNSIILNETAVTTLHLGAPPEAIGRMLVIDDTTHVTVSGIVKDFHFQNFKNPVRPLGLRNGPDKIHYISLKVSKQQQAEAVARIKAVWHALGIPGNPECQWEAQHLAETQGHGDDVKMIGFLFIMFLIIACMGLLGIASHAAGMKTKEVSIRKVLGAGNIAIFFLLSRRYFYLLGIAAAIGVPLGYVTSHVFLQAFVYKVSIGATTLLAGLFAVLAIGLLTFGSQTIRAALTPPARRLDF